MAGYGGLVGAVEPSGARLVQDWELIRRAVLHTEQRIRADVGDLGVPGQSFGVLHLLLYAPNRRLPMTYLAREVSMTAGGFTKLADRLGNAGLIDRRGSEGDRRVVYAALTAAGVRVARRAERRYQAALERHVSSAITPNQLSAAAQRLRPLDEALRAAAGELPETVQPREPSLPDRRRAPN